MDTTDFSFGFAARNGGIDMDVLIDEFNVNYTYFQDCNENDVDDVMEIKKGAAQDCNSNGILDTCDIAAGAPDVNNNDILDECECIGDITGDGVIVNVQDLLSLIGYWGDAGGPGDLNTDGTVNVADIHMLVEKWGPCN